MNKLLAVSAFAVLAASGQAFAADAIGIPAPVVPVPVVDDSTAWEGFYAGLNAGYGWAEVDGVDVDDLDGWLGGAQVGYNWDLSGVVVGVEADYQYSDINADFGVDGDAGLDHFGTVRARVGADVGGFLPYLTAGVAFGELSAEDDTGIDESEYAWGWAAGAGVEAMVTDNVSVKAEYLYLGFEDVDFGAADVDADAHTARVGFNFHF